MIWNTTPASIFSLVAELHIICIESSFVFFEQIFSELYIGMKRKENQLLLKNRRMNVNSVGQTYQGGNTGEMVYWESQYFFPFNELFHFHLYIHSTQFSVKENSF